MVITEHTVYRIDGLAFDTREAAESYEFDRIGEFVDRAILKGVTYGPKDRLKIVSQIVENRDDLIALLYT